jgi:2,3-bisphosphoglycerate-dependent phosphoglycerate mutase
MGDWIALVRHGATLVEPARPAESWALSEAGRLAVVSLARRLAGVSPDVVVSSPELKARQTAELMYPQTEIRLDEDLREHGRATVPFLTPSQFERAVTEFFEQPQEAVLGAESAAAAAQRMERALERLRGTRAAVVSHGRIIGAYVSTLLGVDGLPIWRALQMPDLLFVNPALRRVQSPAEHGVG